MGKMTMAGLTLLAGGTMFGTNISPNVISMISCVSTGTVIGSAFNRIFARSLPPGLHDDASFVITVAAGVGLLQLTIGEFAKTCGSDVLRQLYLVALAVTALAVILKVVSTEAMSYMTMNLAYQHIATAKEFLRHTPSKAAAYARTAWQQLQKANLFSLIRLGGEDGQSGDINYSMVGSCVSLAVAVVTGYLSIQSCLSADNPTITDVLANFSSCSGTTSVLAITSAVLGITGILGLLFSGPLRYLPRLRMDLNLESSMRRMRAAGNGMLGLGSHVLSGAKWAAGGVRALAGQVSSSARSLQPPEMRRALSFYLLASGIAVGVVDAFVPKGNPAKTSLFYTSIALCALGALTTAHGAVRHHNIVNNLNVPSAGPALQRIWNSLLDGASGVKSAMMRTSACDQVLEQLQPIREELQQIRSHLLDAPNKTSWETFSYPSSESEQLFDLKPKTD